MDKVDVVLVTVTVHKVLPMNVNEESTILVTVSVTSPLYTTGAPIRVSSCT